MFRLTREVRFALNEMPDEQSDRPPANSYAGFPSLRGFGRFYRVQVTLQGELDPASSYLRNIKEIDQRAREQLIPALRRRGDSDLITTCFSSMRDFWPRDSLFAVTLWLSPFLSLSQLASEFGMYTRLSQKFEFSASHRLHNLKLSDEENRRIYGKCNNPNGHGHNYEMQVTLRGKPNASGLLVEIPAFERVVKEYAIDKLDHKNLNMDVPEFRELVPTVENISMVIYQTLKGRFTGLGAELAAVTVWETPKTWCEYSE